MPFNYSLESSFCPAVNVCCQASVDVAAMFDFRITILYSVMAPEHQLIALMRTRNPWLESSVYSIPVLDEQ